MAIIVMGSLMVVHPDPKAGKTGQNSNGFGTGIVGFGLCLQHAGFVASVDGRLVHHASSSSSSACFGQLCRLLDHHNGKGQGRVSSFC